MILSIVAVVSFNGAQTGTAGTPPDDSDGEFERGIERPEEREPGEPGDTDEGGTEGDKPPEPVYVPCRWSAPPTAQDTVDSLNAIMTLLDSTIGQLIKSIAFEVEYFRESGVLRRWNPARDRFEQYELADCSRAENEPAVSSGDVRWVSVVPPSPSILIPGLRLVVGGIIRPPESQISPTDRAPVNLGLWFAVADRGPIVAEGRLGPLWARGTATLTSTTFDPGDGSNPIACDGAGVPINDSDTIEQGPCGYTYTSLDDVADDLEITIRSTWTITWTTSDSPNPEPPETMLRTSVLPYDVYEIQTVGT